MKMTVEQFKELKQRVERLTAATNQAEGRIQTHLKALRDVHGCESIEEADLLLEKLEAEHKKLSARCDELFVEFEKKFGESLV